MQFDQAQIDSIARALGDTEDGLTGSEIGHLLSVCRMARHDPGHAVTKWKRIQNAFAMDQNARGNRTAVLEFIRQSMRPALHLTDPDRHERMRFKLNRALALTGLSVDQPDCSAPWKPPGLSVKPKVEPVRCAQAWNDAVSIPTFFSFAERNGWSTIIFTPCKRP